MYIKGNFRYLPSLLRNWLWKSPYSPKNELRSRKQTSVLAENTRTKILRRGIPTHRTKLNSLHVHIQLSKTPCLTTAAVCMYVVSILIPFLQLLHLPTYNFQMTFN